MMPDKKVINILSECPKLPIPRSTVRCMCISKSTPRASLRSASPRLSERQGLDFVGDLHIRCFNTIIASVYFYFD